MEFTKEQIVNALNGLYESGIDKTQLTNAIKNNVLEGKITQTDVKDLVNKIYPPTLDDEGNVVKEYELLSLDDVKKSKKAQISNQIGQIINAGVMYNDKQYSCKLEDQFTVKAMLDLMTETDTMYYNSNGGSCDPFTYAELGGLLQAMMGHVKYNKTLNGEIKVYIDSLGNIDDVNAFSLDSVPQSVIDATMAKLG